jgi:hypothetical protein
VSDFCLFYKVSRARGKRGIAICCVIKYFKGIVSRKFDILFLVSLESLEVSTPLVFYPFF